MKRWILAVTAAITMVGGLGVTAAQAQPLTPHAPILITSNASLKAVSSNGAACGLNQACTVEGWDIHPPAGGTCISVTGGTNLTLPFIIQHNRCTGGTKGVVLTNTPAPMLGNKVIDNTINNLNGTAIRRDAEAIELKGVNLNLTIADNVLTNIQGRSGGAAGEDGGSAYGIRVPAGAATIATMTGNRIVWLVGGSGAPGAPNHPGGAGGSAYGIFVGTPQSSIAGPSGVVGVTNNTISQLYGALGGFSGFGTTGNGRDGGAGGNAIGAFLQGSISNPLASLFAQADHNNISLLFGSFGGYGGAGGPGANGGTGGKGGDADGIVLDEVAGTPSVSLLTSTISVAPVLRAVLSVASVLSTTPVVASSANNNTIFQLYGGYGGVGGNGGLGGVGGNGGHGGDGVGINKLTSPDVPTTGNAINFFFFGLGGIGGFPLGANGGPGIAAPILGMV